MKALLLAAGYGTRLKPLTDKTPKCLVPIQGRPLLNYWLELLTNAGISKFLVNTHYLAEEVRSFVEASEYRDQIFLVHEEELLGTGGTLLRNKDYFSNEPMMLIHADNLSRFDARSFMERHANRPIGCEITMMTFSSPTPESSGIVEVNDEGIVHAFHEKVKNPPSCLANGAVYILEPSVIDFIEGLNCSIVDFSTEVIPSFMGKIFTFHNDDYHRDIGTMESYLASMLDFRLPK